MAKIFTLEQLTETSKSESSQRTELIDIDRASLKSNTISNILAYSKALSIQDSKFLGKQELVLN